MLRDAVGRLGARLLAHAAVRHGSSTRGETAGGRFGSRAFLSSSRLFSAHPAPLPEEEPPADTVGCALARMLEQVFATTSLILYFLRANSGCFGSVSKLEQV